MIILRINDLILFRVFGISECFSEFIIVRAGHDHINIVIPRNAGLISDSTDQRAGYQHIIQAVLPADPVENV